MGGVKIIYDFKCLDQLGFYDFHDEIRLLLMISFMSQISLLSCSSGSKW